MLFLTTKQQSLSHSTAQHSTAAAATNKQTNNAYVCVYIYICEHLKLDCIII
jgi:hypothetical protein